MILYCTVCRELQTTNDRGGAVLMHKLIDLPSLCSKLLYEFAVLSSCDTIKVFANVLWKYKVRWVALLEVEKQSSEEATGLSLGLCALCGTAETVPSLVQFRRILTQGRVKTVEME